MQSTVNIPVILEFNDYHEINPLLEQLNVIFKKKLKSEELFANNGYYYAIFYFKKDRNYKSMVKKHEADVRWDGDE